MSERSFAVGSVVLALAFGLVVPDPGASHAPATGAGIGMAAPEAPAVHLPAPQEKESAAVHTVAFAAQHGARQKTDGRTAALWSAVHRAP